MTAAANHLASNHNGGKLPEKGTITGTYDGVRVIAQVNHGEIVSIYPDAKKHQKNFLKNVKNIVSCFPLSVPKG